ncbi:neurogenin-1-like [Portunus trituberculatus]|uniref:neurogenin-1-like n=1 Tax=Portunus trituberculatus TaxID=210409 RepID=UPI001E1CEC34|nr:neurogenin-1-like [Portunus trituberculatus]
MIGTSGQQAGRPERHPSWPSLDGSNNSNNINIKNTNCSTSSEEKYGLRPRTIIKRLQHDRGHQQVSKVSKGLARPKSRPAPLSKYRRKTANARERHRMREINNAFESLRRVLPDKLEMEAASSSMTKITTLRLAADYIRALNDVLQEEGGEALCSLQCSAQNTLLRVAPTQPRHHLLPLDCFSPATHMSASASRGSLSTSSCSDLEDLLSDDSCSLLDDNFDVFHDIPILPGGDPLDLLLEAEKGLLPLPQELCN